MNRFLSWKRTAEAWRVSGLLIVVLLAGCSQDMGDLKAWVKAQKDRKPPPIEPLPEIKPYETFIYEAQNLRDPFRLPTMSEVAAQENSTSPGLRPDFNRRRELLEAFPLDSLAMVGTFARKGQQWALIKDPEGVVHHVKEGNYMGTNFGKVIEIREDRVVLRELVPNGNGGYEERVEKILLDQG